jgi:hypothetical protein
MLGVCQVGIANQAHKIRRLREGNEKTTNKGGIYGGASATERSNPYDGNVAAPFDRKVGGWNTPMGERGNRWNKFVPEWKRNNTCRKCGSPSHYARDCVLSRRRGGNVPEEAGIEATAAPNEVRLQVMTAEGPQAEVYMRVKLHGRPMYALLDSGCEVSVVDARSVVGIPLEQTNHTL